MSTIQAFFRGIWTLILSEPVYAQALVVAGIALGSAFGLGWTGAQVGAVSAFSAALLSFMTRQAVTPTVAPVLPAGTDVTVTTPGPVADQTVTL
jgi:hypothetical protein